MTTEPGPWHAVAALMLQFRLADAALLETRGDEVSRFLSEHVPAARRVSLSDAGDVPWPVAGLVYIDVGNDRDRLAAAIRLALQALPDNGVVCGPGYGQHNTGVFRAVADRFNLLDVGLMPAGVWFVEKRNA